MLGAPQNEQFCLRHIIVSELTKPFIYGELALSARLKEHKVVRVHAKNRLRIETS